MILPEKHIRLNECIFGLAGLIYYLMNDGESFVDLHIRYTNVNRNFGFRDQHTIEHFSLALDFLFMFDLIELKDGLLWKSKKQ